MNTNISRRFIALIFIVHLFSSERLSAQIILQADDFPSSIGTYFITEEDTVDTVVVDVGRPGENQLWKFDAPFPCELARQLIVDKATAPYHLDFPEANIVTRYAGKLGQLIHSYYFNNTQGVFYSFQNINHNSLTVQGIGIESAVASFEIFKFGYSGAVDVEPDLLYAPFPLHYGISWQSVSQFTIEVDTLFYGSRVIVTTDVKDSIVSTVDGWGRLALPSGSFECLRIKSYVNLLEKIYINGVLFRSRPSTTINYHWLAKGYGVVAKIISHHGQTDDNFKIAKQVSRLYRFNPMIELSLPDTIAAPHNTLLLPIYISDVTDLDISAIQMQLHYNAKILEPIEIVTHGSLSESWNHLSYTLSDSGINLELSGENSLIGRGVLCYVRFLINPNAQENAFSLIELKHISAMEPGPHIRLKPGRVTIILAFDIAGRLGYYSNNQPIANAQIQLNQSQVTSGQDGRFAFLHVQKGDYQLTPSKQGDWSDCITAFDASLILRHVVGLITLTPYQLIAADVTGNKSVSSLDASYILRYSVGLIDSFQVGTGWTFVPSQFAITDKNWHSAPHHISFQPLNSHQTDQDFKGIIYGDVSGNWSPTHLNFAARMKPYCGQAKVQWGEAKLTDDPYWELPIEIAANCEILSARIQLSFDSKQWKFRGLRLNEDLNNCLIEQNEQHDKVVLAIASSQPIGFDEHPLLLLFERIQPHSENINSIRLDNIHLNEDMVQVTIAKNPVTVNSSQSRRFILAQNYPNPFNATTLIRFVLPEADQVRITIFDAMGQEVANLLDENLPAGQHEIRWTAAHLSSGIYFYQLQTGRFKQKRKMLVIK